MSILSTLFFIAVIVCADQFSKTLIVEKFALRESVEIIPGFFRITYVQNTGAGFSILEGQRTFFLIVTVIALAAFIYLLIKSETALGKAALIMMIGGTIGNFIDRLLHVYVVDFLDFIIFGYDFPVFNIADSFLTVGVFLMIIDLIRSERHAKA